MNYFAKVTPNLAETTAPMRSLLKKDSEFVWDCIQQTAHDKMKLLITSAGTLAYYDVKEEVTLGVDAFKHGLGAVLMQEGKPVAYASKSLSLAEQDYAQIEKEMYAIVLGTKRFHQYTYGRNIAVTTDHKPLEAILSKPQSAAPARLQVMFWPSMNSQIEDIVSNCPTCTKHQSSNPKEPMIAHELPERPWKNVATDLFTLDNEQYLIVVDYYSRYFELERMSTTTSLAIINNLTAIFARHGIPEK